MAAFGAAVWATFSHLQERGGEDRTKYFVICYFLNALRGVETRGVRKT